MKHFAVATAILFVVAASASDIAETVATTGYHVDRNASATNECVSASVSDARNDGGNLSIVVLAEEPPGGATTFSEAVLSELDGIGTVFTVAPESIGYRDTEAFWSADQFDTALDEALTVASDNDVVRTFVNSLTGDDAVCSTTSIAGKSAWGFIVFVLIVVGGLGFLIWRSARSGRERRVAALASAKTPLQAQIDDVANDILELEAEVRGSGNQEAVQHFNDATAVFTIASDRLTSANTPQAMLDLGYDLDLAIWNLDCAEALLDGKNLPPKPSKPEPPKPPPSPSRGEPETTQPSSSVSLPDDLPRTLPKPPSAGHQPTDYQRRDQRRSQYGSDGLMAALLAMQALNNRGGGSIPGGFSGRSGGASRTTGRSRSSTPKPKGSRGGRRRG